MGKIDKVRGKSDKYEARSSVEIGLLLYPGVQSAAVDGLTDLFVTANRLSREREGPRAPQLRVTHWKLSNKTERLEVVFDTQGRDRESLVALILPPSLDSEPCGEPMQSHARWIAAQHAKGTVVCSICAGAFLLAQTGLLNGRSATTHWIHVEKLHERFPEVHLTPDVLIVDDGDIITAGGVMAWIDLGLRLIHRWISPSVMMATARFFLVDAAGREQRFYSTFAPRLHHGDAAVLQTQHWLQLHFAENLTGLAMATQAKLGERTLLRRFRRATGLKPKEYVQHLRVGRARETLEFSALSINEISWKVGYEDPGAFRKVFQKIMGLSPGEYRRRFGIADR
jgi:transcriptional regulator GlxA family with amidase domain